MGGAHDVWFTGEATEFLERVGRALAEDPVADTVRLGIA